jgi:predicted ArsR family transcriptional regulator
METNEVSEHLAKLFLAAEKAEKWMTSKELAKQAGVSDRTARAHCLKLVKAGILDQAEVFPAHRYRLSKMADKRNKTFLARIRQAAEILGL